MTTVVLRCVFVCCEESFSHGCYETEPQSQVLVQGTPAEDMYALEFDRVFKNWVALAKGIKHQLAGRVPEGGASD